MKFVVRSRKHWFNGWEFYIQCYISQTHYWSSLNWCEPKGGIRTALYICHLVKRLMRQEIEQYEMHGNGD